MVLITVNTSRTKMYMFYKETSVPGTLELNRCSLLSLRCLSSGGLIGWKGTSIDTVAVINAGSHEKVSLAI